ncbi:hypothetical protein ABVB70_26335 [Agrobacterium radiobacter]|uniref:Uncharacterized protein n=1 Tax=Agrobacterium radiobacter TaxID=362 RepID=A0ABD5LPK3_AGRRD
MREMFQNRWEIVAGYLICFMVITGLNKAISQMTVEISPLSVEASDFASPINRNNETSLQPFSDLVLPETFARPVFSPTRREFVEPPLPSAKVDEASAEIEPVKTVPLKLPPIKLLGTRVVEGRRSVLIHLTEMDATWLNEGDTVGGWKISSIASDGISLSSGVQSIVVSLYD